MSASRQELLKLLDRLCEDRLRGEEHARLQDLVTTDDEALRLYLDYIALHGTLHWDTAVGDDVPGPPPTVAAALPSATVTKARRGRFWMMVASSAALALIASVVLTPPDDEPLAVNPAHPGSSDNSPVLVEDAPEGAGDTAPPIVRLDARINATDSAELPVGSPRSGISRPADARTSDIVEFIDEQLAQAWDASDVSPSPLADDGEWLRRASLDLAGRIPDLDSVHAFLDSRDPDKRKQFVKQMLQGGQFAENLTSQWANLLVGRKGTSDRQRRGLEEFLLSQFRQNRPWNETVEELIAAEGTVEENGAAGFLLAHLNNEAVPATAITARVFLGEQVQCTQCHKHPWNDEPQDQFWTLNAFFQQTDIERRSVTDSETGQEQRVPALVRREIGGPTYYEDLRGVMQVAYPQFAGESIDPDAAINRRRELARLLSEEEGHQLARAFVNRMWAHFFGYGFVNPVDDMGPHHPATHPELLDRLASEFARSGYDIAQLVTWITSSRAYQLTSRVTEANTIDDPAIGNPPLFSRLYIKPLAPEQLFDSVLVATTADQAGGRQQRHSPAERQKWVEQFFAVLENEENGELSTFDGTIPQALAMMNGPLVQAALSGEPGTLLHHVMNSRNSDADKIRDLCLAALGRAPTERERNLFSRHVRRAESHAAKTDAFRDVFWAYLNSTEFVVNH